jgi:hypothetical protein
MNPGSPPEQPGRDDPRIVEHQQFVTAKKIEYFKEKTILEPACGPLHQEKSRSFTPIQRLLSDPLLWQEVVEVV